MLQAIPDSPRVGTSNPPEKPLAASDDDAGNVWKYHKNHMRLIILFTVKSATTGGMSNFQTLPFTKSEGIYKYVLNIVT